MSPSVWFVSLSIILIRSKHIVTHEIFRLKASSYKFVKCWNSIFGVFRFLGPTLWIVLFVHLRCSGVTTETELFLGKSCPNFKYLVPFGPMMFVHVGKPNDDGRFTEWLQIAHFEMLKNGRQTFRPLGFQDYLPISFRTLSSETKKRFSHRTIKRIKA